jgi:hypothetical protein
LAERILASQIGFYYIDSFCGSFSNTISVSEFMASNDRVIVEYELTSIWKETIMA